MTPEEIKKLVIKPVDQLATISGIPNGKIPFYDGSNELKLMDVANFNNLSKTAKPLKPTDATPTTEGLYMPTEAGTYTNADGLVAQEGYYTLFFLNGTTWTKSEVKMPKPSILKWEELSFPISDETQFIYQNEFYKLKVGETATISDVPGISNKYIKIGDNYRIDANIINYPIGGYVNLSGQIVSGNVDSDRRTDYVFIKKGDIISAKTRRDVASIAVFDIDKKLYEIPPTQTDGGSYQWINDYVAPIDGYIISSTSNFQAPNAYKESFYSINRPLNLKANNLDLSGGATSYNLFRKKTDTSALKTKNISPNIRKSNLSIGGVVSFIDDDGNKDVLDYLLPMMASKGLKMASAIISHWTTIKPTNYLGNPLLTIDELKKCLIDYPNNFEILNHTSNHTSFTGDNTAPLFSEMEISNKWFMENLKFIPTGFVNPFGHYSWNGLYVTSQYHKYAFSTDIGVNYINATFSNYTIKRLQFGNPATGGNVPIAQIKSYIQEAIQNNGWVVIMTHVKGFDDYPNWRTDFEELCDYIVAQNIKCLLPSEAFSIFGNIIENINDYNTGFKMLANGSIVNN